MKKKIVIVAAAIVAIILLLSVVEVSGLFRSDKTIVVEISQGSGTKAISSKLKENKVIGSKLLFEVYSKLTNEVYHAGAHSFDSKSYGKIAEELAKPAKPKTALITIPEGYEQREIAQLLEKNGL